MSVFSRAVLFRKKSPDGVDGGSHLQPCLGAWDLTLLGIGAIIGTGIFVLTGVAAATQAGPAVVLSFVVAGLACTFAALSYAELSSSVGGCGSAYGYSYAAFGEVIAWIIGWDLVLEYGVAVAAVANGWSGYLVTGLSAMDIHLPVELTLGPSANAWKGFLNIVLEPAGLGLDYDPAAEAGGWMNLPAVVIILALMCMLIKGVKESARLNTAMVFVKLLAIAVFIGVAMFNVKPELWDPFMPFGWFEKLENGKTVGVLAGASVVFFAYVGFDAVSTAVEEARNPKRDVPIGILSSLIFCTLIYIIVSGLLTGVVPYTDLDVSSPVAHALELLGINWASALVATGVITGLTTVMLVLYYGLTRIIFAMSRDGLLPTTFSAVHEKTHTPVRTTVVCGVIMAVMAGLIPLGALAELVNIGTLAAFIIVCGGVIVMRYTHKEMPRAFRVPFGITLPVLGILSCGALIAFLPTHTHERFVLWLLAGFAIYFLYSVKHSRLAQNNA